MSAAKMEALFTALRGWGRVAVGFSGGVDSTMLLAAAARTLGAQNTLAVIADTPSLPRAELRQALDAARALGVACAAVRTDEINDPAYAANTPQRCYICKKLLFTAVAAEAAARGFGVVLDGGNADDVSDIRPGRRAAAELGVRSPLEEAGLTKAEIRAASARWSLPTADKPALACLATRIPCGTRITAAALAMVEAAEEALKAAGFAQCRARHHGDAVRVEVPAADIARLASDAVRPGVDAALKAAGYKYAALDLAGYKTGNMNG